MTLDQFSLNGKIKPIAEAAISVINIEYAYGFGVYETIRVVGGIPYFLKEHAERLLASAEIIGLTHCFSETSVSEYVRKLITQLAVNEAYNLKVLLVGSKSEDGCLLYIFPSKPLFPEKKMQRNGVEVITVAYERPFPNAKTLNMLQSYMAFRKAHANNCYDALAVDRTATSLKEQ